MKRKRKRKKNDLDFFVICAEDVGLSTILICFSTRYHKVESENKNCFRLTIYCVISISFTWKY